MKKGERMNIEIKFKCGDDVFVEGMRYIVNTVDIHCYLNNLTEVDHLVDEPVYSLRGTPNTYRESELKSVQEYRDMLFAKVKELDEELNNN